MSAGLGLSEKGTVTPGPEDFPREAEAENKTENDAQKDIEEAGNEELE
jgi:hypothetical protein